MGVLSSGINKPKSSERGQALLIVLLAMAVILTVVLSITSRSVVDITTTTYQEDSLRAFSAAEAGVEEVLLKQSAAYGTLDSSANVTYNAQLTNPIAGRDYIYPNLLSSGEIATFWFVKHDSSTYALTCSGGGCTRANQIEICFGNTDNSAVEVSVYYDTTFQSYSAPNDYANLKVARLVRDTSNARTLANNFGFTAANCPFGGSTFNHSTGAINLNTDLSIGCGNNNPSCLVMAKVRILYNISPQPVGIRVTGSLQELPAQGFQIDSSGTSGESVRKLNVVRGYPEPASVFDSAIFSLNGITK